MLALFMISTHETVKLQEKLVIYKIFSLESKLFIIFIYHLCVNYLALPLALTPPQEFVFVEVVQYISIFT